MLAHEILAGCADASGTSRLMGKWALHLAGDGSLLPTDQLNLVRSRIISMDLRVIFVPVSSVAGAHDLTPGIYSNMRSRFRQLSPTDLDGPALNVFHNDIHKSLSPIVALRLAMSSEWTQRRVLGIVKGYQSTQRSCPWSNDAFVDMLLDNEDNQHPRIWEHTWVGLHLPLHMMQLPLVAEWHENHHLHRRKHRLTVAIRGFDPGLILRFEEWILWEPGLRLEKVLAHRARPSGLCGCCQRPALWRITHGRYGCGAYIMRTVAREVFRTDWGVMTRCLSHSRTSPLEQLLSQDWFNDGVFEDCFVDLDCLSCSCGACSLRNTRAGVLCPLDQLYAMSTTEWPPSPRAAREHLLAEDLLER